MFISLFIFLWRLSLLDFSNKTIPSKGNKKIILIERENKSDLIRHKLSSSNLTEGTFCLHFYLKKESTTITNRLDSRSNWVTSKNQLMAIFFIAKIKMAHPKKKNRDRTKTL